MPCCAWGEPSGEDFVYDCFSSQSEECTHRSSFSSSAVCLSMGQPCISNWRPDAGGGSLADAFNV